MIAPGVALLLGFGATAARGEEPSPLVAVAAVAPPIQVLTFPGQTRGWYDSEIYARVSGYVAGRSVDIGDPVKKGQLLATIDTPDLDAELASAQAQLQASEDEVKLIKVDTEFAATTYQLGRDRRMLATVPGRGCIAFELLI